MIFQRECYLLKSERCEGLERGTYRIPLQSVITDGAKGLGRYENDTFKKQREDHLS